MVESFFHLDLDAFFASVEQLDHPEYRGRPVIVGARPGGRGVVSTCSYEARSFGVHSAMPISEASRRCPTAIFLPVRMRRYAELSDQVMSICAQFAPEMRQVSIDEASLNMSGTERLWGPPAAAAESLKARIVAETGLTVSVGVAANRYVAKIASGLKKPDGLVVVEAGEEEDFMLALPMEKLWGAGEKTQERLRSLGIFSTPQLASFSEKNLVALFGIAGGRFLYSAVRGRDAGMMSGAPESRSMSTETTFEYDTKDALCLEAVLLEMADTLGYRLWREKLRSRTLVLKLRLYDFTTFSRRFTQARPFNDSASVMQEARKLLSRVWDGRTPVRLIGLGFAELEDGGTPSQGELFVEEDGRRRRVEETVFDIERRGIGALRRARLIGGREQRRGRGND